MFEHTPSHTEQSHEVRTFLSDKDRYLLKHFPSLIPSITLVGKWSHLVFIIGVVQFLAPVYSTPKYLNMYLKQYDYNVYIITHCMVLHKHSFPLPHLYCMPAQLLQSVQVFASECQTSHFLHWGMKWRLLHCTRFTSYTSALCDCTRMLWPCN